METPQYCLLGIQNWDLTCMTRSDWASWAQAIGTFAALLIAVGVPWYQGRNSQKRETERIAEASIARVRNRRLSVCDAASELYLIVGSVNKYTPTVRFPWTGIANVYRRLGDIEHDVADQYSFHQSQRLRAIANDFEAAVAHRDGTWVEDADKLEKLAKLASSISQDARRASKTAEPINPEPL